MVLLLYMAWRSTHTQKGVLIACLETNATNQTHRIALSVSDNERRFSPNLQRSPQKEEKKKKKREHANNKKYVIIRSPEPFGHRSDV